METPPRIGCTHQQSFAVDDSRTIDFSQEGLPAVLATPWLIWFLEQTALELMESYLEPGEMTVGTNVEMEHLAPTPVGDDIVCRARVVQVDGPIVSFQIEAHDSSERVAKGLHKRCVVDASRFARRVTKKLGD